MANPASTCFLGGRAGSTQLGLNDRMRARIHGWKCKCNDTHNVSPSHRLPRIDSPLTFSRSAMSSDRQADAEAALAIARQRLAEGKFNVARRLAMKSKGMYETRAADELVEEISRREAAAVGGGGDGAEAGERAEAKASGAEVHPSAAGTHQRPGHGTGKTSSGNGEAAAAAKARESTPEQRAVVKRVRACKVTEYYAILDCESYPKAGGTYRGADGRALQCKRHVRIMMFEKRTAR